MSTILRALSPKDTRKFDDLMAEMKCNICGRWICVSGVGIHVMPAVYCTVSSSSEEGHYCTDVVLADH